MDLKIWLFYLITEFLLGITPGPAVLLVSMQGLKYGSSSSNFGALGISTGNLLYFILSAFGLGTLILTTGNVFDYIKILGALYLIISGLNMFYHSYKNQDKPTADPAITLTQSKLHSYVQGFITQAANPKAIIFFIALLPQFITPEKNILLQFLIFGATTLVVETFILIAYGKLTSKSKKMAGQNNIFKKWSDRISAFILVSLGINLFFMKKG